MRAHKTVKSGLRPSDRVAMINCYETEEYADRVWTVESEPWECCGSEIVLLEGKSGGFDTSRLRKVAT